MKRPLSLLAVRWQHWIYLLSAVTIENEAGPLVMRRHDACINRPNPKQKKPRTGRGSIQPVAILLVLQTSHVCVSAVASIAMVNASYIPASIARRSADHIPVATT